MIVTNSDLAHLGRTAKPLAWSGLVTTILIVAMAVLRQAVSYNLPSLPVSIALNVVTAVLVGVAATLFCLSFSSAQAVRAMSSEVGHRDDEWRRQLILLEIDEPSSQDPPTADPAIVALAAFTRWFHSSISFTALFFIGWIVLQWITDNIRGLQVDSAVLYQLLSWSYAPLRSLTQTVFLFACEMVILLILAKRWATAP